MSKLLLSLQFEEQLPNVVRDELQQLTSGIQVWGGAIGKWGDIGNDRVIFYTSSGGIILGSSVFRTVRIGTDLGLVYFAIGGTPSGGPSIIYARISGLHAAAAFTTPTAYVDDGGTPAMVLVGASPLGANGLVEPGQDLTIALSRVDQAAFANSSSEIDGVAIFQALD